jgi:CspA family cold shock protein
MTQGTVRWFNLAKGYGFITADGGDEVFVRFNEIQAEGLRVLADGQRVEFEMSSDDAGPQAASVRTLQ